MKGHVSLVGAGPGDPGLLTRRAVVRLRAADLVLYDALVDERVLTIARRARRFFVGKRAGRHSMTQDAINALMIRAARRGRRIVRLKGGDPFLFGRGGEEAVALQRAGVPYDVVPGVSNAIAAPALAGIPVTHRGVSAAMLVVSGHDEEAFASMTRGLAPNSLTIVVLMGVGRSAQIAWSLLDAGWSRRTPVALIAAASTPKQQIWRGTLGVMADGPALADVAAGSPATIVIGDVVAVNRQVALEQVAACGS